MTEGQGKSTIAPTFSKWGYNDEDNIPNDVDDNEFINNSGQENKDTDINAAVDDRDNDSSDEKEDIIVINSEDNNDKRLWFRQ